MWYDTLKRYDKIYVASHETGGYYFDTEGKLITRSYKEPNPGNSHILRWYEKENPPVYEDEIDGNYTECTGQVEFTTEGLIYTFGRYYIWWDGDVECEEFGYIFVPYDDE
jgi:hypothetical protein